MPVQNVEGSGRLWMFFSWIAPPGYGRAYVKSEHLCVGCVVGLAISRSLKPGLNLSFSC